MYKDIEKKRESDRRRQRRHRAKLKQGVTTAPVIPSRGVTPEPQPRFMYIQGRWVNVIV